MLICAFCSPRAPLPIRLLANISPAGGCKDKQAAFSLELNIFGVNNLKSLC